MLDHKLTFRRMCEEVRDPARQVPKAMVATVALNTICGLVFLIPLVFVLPDQKTLAGLLSGQPVPTIILDAVGSPGAAIALLVPILVLGLLCGIGCTTAASRATWAFSRDGAMPGHKWWSVINPKLEVPFNAMMLSMVIQLALGLIYFGAVAAFNAFSGVGVICLTLSYAIPIVSSLATGRKQVKEGSFYLGGLGTFCNVVALGMFFQLFLALYVANIPSSLVRSRDTVILHAHYYPRHSFVDELCISRARRCHHRFNHLVLRVGQEELRGSSNTRGCHSGGEEG